MRVTVATNSTPIIGLASLGELEILKKLFEKVYITKYVYEEVTGDAGKIGAEQLKKQINEGSIILYDTLDNKLVELMFGRLHRGELSVMVAAKELGISYVLMDDAYARKTAESFSLVPIGTAGILKLAKIKGFVSELKPLVDNLIDNNFRISLKLYNQI